MKTFWAFAAGLVLGAGLGVGGTILVSDTTPLFTSVTEQKAAQQQISPVLARLGDYVAPEKTPGGPEPYDYRMGMDIPVPSKPLALVTDVCFLAEEYFGRGFDPSVAEDSFVAQVLDLYRTRRWSSTIGLRPWTHTNFVRSLSDAEFTTLVEEVGDTLRSIPISERCDEALLK